MKSLKNELNQLNNKKNKGVEFNSKNLDFNFSCLEIKIMQRLTR